MHIKALICDLNGVLIEGLPFSERFEKKYLVPQNTFWPALQSALKLSLTPKSPGIYELLTPYFEQWNIQINETELLQFWRSGESESGDMMDLCSHVRTKNIQIFVISNNFCESTEHYSEHMPLLNTVIDQAYYSWQTGYLKPDPRAYEQLLQEHSLSPNECIYFDDTQVNVEAAKALGIHSFYFTGVTEARQNLLACGIVL